MENEEYKNCPNCNTRLSFNDTRCFNCKYDFKLNRIIDDSLKCPNCGLDVSKGQKYCMVCGAKLEFKQCIHCGAFFDAKLDKCSVCNKEQIKEVETNINDDSGELLTSEMSLDMRKEYYLNMGRIRLFMFFEFIILSLLTVLVLFTPFLMPNTFIIKDNTDAKFMNGIDYFKCIFTNQNFNDYLVNQEGYLLFSKIGESLASLLFTIIYGLLFTLIIANYVRVVIGFIVKKPNKGIMLTILMIYLALLTIFGEIITLLDKFNNYDCMATYGFVIIFIFWIITVYVFNKETKNYEKHFKNE